MSLAADARLDALTDWTRQRLGAPEARLSVASADASFRRYFRVQGPQGTCIAMDAPPDREDSVPYIDIARRLRAAGLQAPAILHHDLSLGFLLISDLGSRSYLQLLDEDSVEHLYDLALQALARIQLEIPARDLPPYDRQLLSNEMALFHDWFLGRHLGISLDARQQRVLTDTCELLIESALAQPRCVVHRDYHSRNLMLTPDGEVGILDFQDAVIGPVTYDLVSLLRDCYIDWPDQRVYAWAEAHRLRLTGSPLQMPADDFRRAFDLMGLQRHLKAIGIFARLHHRDGKPGYLDDIPRTLGYALQVSAAHPETRAFHDLLQSLQLAQRPGA